MLYGTKVTKNKSRASVIAILGKTNGKVSSKDTEVLIFHRGSVTFTNGVVSAVDIMSDDKYEVKVKTELEQKTQEAINRAGKLQALQSELPANDPKNPPGQL